MRAELEVRYRKNINWETCLLTLTKRYNTTGITLGVKSRLADIYGYRIEKDTHCIDIIDMNIVETTEETITVSVHFAIIEKPHAPNP